MSTSAEPAGPAMLAVVITRTPSQYLNPNRRGKTKVGSIARGRERWELRGEATKATRRALRSDRWTHERVDLSVTVRWEKGRRLWDDDNLIAALKSVRDGIADALGVDDAKFRWCGVEQELGSDRVGRMVIVVEAK